MDFERFTKDIIANNWNVYGVEVYVNNVLTHSFGDTTNNIYDIYSATKSILSVAVGIAYDRGLIELDKSVLEYLPQKKVNSMSPEKRNMFARITMRRLLTMSVAGFPFRPEEPSYLDFSLSCEISDPDEVTFNYSNIDAYLTGVALTEALGSDLGKFIEDEVLAPLGITNYEYMRCPDGYFYGASKMKLSVHDLSQIGLLMMNDGIINGRRILSANYVRMATSIQQMNRQGGYGFYFWKYKDGYSINGKWEQKCYCLPSRNMVITYLSHIEDDSHDLLISMEKHLLGIENT